MNRKLILMKKSLINLPVWQLFTLYLLLYFLLWFCLEEFVYYDPKYFTGGNENSVRVYRTLLLLMYILLPLTLLIKFKFFQLTISLSLPESLKTAQNFNTLILKLLISGSFILLIPRCAKVIWFMFLSRNYTMEQADDFSLFSLYHLLSQRIDAQAYEYLLKWVNPFEMIYILYLTLGLTIYTKQNINKSMICVLKGYVLPLMMYAGLKIFVNVYFFKL